ncbi:MAG: hypothetical protein EOP83_05910 [Verrucomicrobiaceae bacterium]|nr:MAG: hypothetical protein EOP83_05910 [Verrucomicrobiaceae bacterium]
MMRFVRVDGGNPLYPHQFHLQKGSETGRVATNFYAEAVTWATEQIGPFGQTWTMSGYTISFRRDTDALLFRIRWG